MTTESEQRCIADRYSHCDQTVERPDFVFAHPQSEFIRNPETTADLISQQWTVLRALSCRNPTASNADRVIIGYRHQRDEPGSDCDPGYSRDENRTPFINIPWGYLRFDEQPLECLSHELVHAFDDVSPVTPPTTEWKEGMCEFMRLFALHACGMKSIAEEKADCYRRAAYTSGADSYHDFGGRLLLFLEQSGYSISAQENCEGFVRNLWNSDLESLVPISKVG